MSARQQQALEFFIRQGWTAAQASGIVANLEAESGLRPDAVGDGGQAYGIAQWHPDRQEHFREIIGKDIHESTLEDQLIFVHAEMQRWEKPAADALRECTTAAEAGACVSMRYERPADTEGDAAKRAVLAETILQTYGGMLSPNTPAAPGPTTVAVRSRPTRAASPSVRRSPRGVAAARATAGP